MVKKITSYAKFRLVLWKNFVLQFNNKCEMFFEIISPVIFALIITFLRVQYNTQDMPERHFNKIWLGDRTMFSGEEYNPIDQDEKLEFVIAYSPSNGILEKILQEAHAKTLIANKKPISYSNAKEMSLDLRNHNYLVAVEFDDSYATLTEYPKQFAFTLRFPSELRSTAQRDITNFNTTTWETNYLFSYPTPGPRNAMANDDGIPCGYFREHFIQIQYAIAMSYLELKLGNIPRVLPEIFMQRFPYAAYTADSFIYFVNRFVPQLVMVSFLMLCINVTRYAAEEKEKQLKEFMKMLGIPNWIHWLAWFVRAMTSAGISIIALVLIYKIGWSKGVAVLNYSHWTVIFLFFFVYTIAVVTFSFMVSVMFKKAATAAALAGLLFFVSFLPVGLILIEYYEMSAILKSFLCLDFNIAMCLGIMIILEWEAVGAGINWSNIFEVADADNNLSFGVVILMMMIAAIIYMAVCLYIEQVFPGEYGVPKKWNFLFKHEHWTEKTKYRQNMTSIKMGAIERDNAQAFERETINKSIGIKIRDLNKRYGNEWAVKNVSLDMYEDEITVLLGHNGAGKTTTLAMLTGIITPTSGVAQINGYNISTDIDSARASMGICPHINVLFDDMSVADHLVFFSKLRGLSGEAVRDEVDRYLRIMKMTDKAKVLSSALSGGKKRKLTLCTALCGHTKIVLCDEPSSGMDPAARRQLWDLLQAEKQGRTVLLTTHFMTEADILGDRIAIMCDGEIKCHGSSFFLKKKFGSGYRLICVKTENCDIDAVTDLIRQHMPDIEPASETGSELTYILPDDYTSIYGNIFTDLENNMTVLGLSGFGVGIPSLEEVFMKVGGEYEFPRFTGGADKGADDHKKPNNPKNLNVPALDSESSRSIIDLNSQRMSQEEAARQREVQRRSEQNSTKRNTMESEVHNFDLLASDHDDETDNDVEKDLKNAEETEKKNRNSRDKFQKRLSFNLFESESKQFFHSKLKSRALNQWHAMFYKKAKSTWRNKFLILLQILFGILVIVVAGMTIKFSELKDLPPLTFSLKHYAQATTYVETSAKVLPGTLQHKIANKYKKLVETADGKYEAKLLTKTNGTEIGNIILKLSKEDQVNVNQNYLTAATFDQDIITIWFNNQPLHMAPLALNLILSAMAKALFGDDAEITVTNHPLPYKSQTRVKYIFTDISSTHLATLISFGMAFISALYALPIIKEKTTRCKLIQFVSGVRVWTYWLTHFLWDLFTLTVTIILMFICIAAFQLEVYSTFQHLTQFFLLTFVFCASVLPVTYLLAGMFDDTAEGFTRIALIYFFSGYGLILIIIILDEFFGILDAISVETVHYLFILLPHFSFAYGWLVLDGNIRKKWFCRSDRVKAIPPDILCKKIPSCCESPELLAWEHPGIRLDIVALLSIGAFCFILLFFMDCGCLHFIAPCSIQSHEHKSVNAEDSDVRAERNLVKNMPARERSQYYLVVDNLAKYYKKFLAVNYLSFCLRGQQCFGLLGVNGAGKTTTFRMLTSDISISSGDAYVRGTSIQTHLLAVYRKIGYCPQVDALLEDLTGREIMFIFCLLRGISSDKIQATTEELAQALGFLKHIDKRCGTYSNGHKRKLSTAIALVGAPSVIYLDEPTAGLDPVARRQIWNVICLVRDHGRLIVLTSHSMDECEALCTRLAIMVNGEFKCIGSPQHLKNKYSKGLVLKIRAEHSMEKKSSDRGTLMPFEIVVNISRIKEAILKKYEEAVIQSEYRSLITIYIPLSDIKWSEIFDWIETNRKQLKIEDYSINQASLEEIFLDFAKAQIADTRDESGRRCC